MSCFFFETQVKSDHKINKKPIKEWTNSWKQKGGKRKGGNRSGQKHDGGGQRAEKTDRLTQQWRVQRVVLIVAMETQDTFNLHIWGHEWGRGHLWEKFLPWLLTGGTQRAQIQSVRNVDTHVCTNKVNQF